MIDSFVTTVLYILDITVMNKEHLTVVLFDLLTSEK